ncbi:RICIN domain-containing protein [Bifidobacterium callimiconis]|uniref:1,4-beta-N-acetylmuramidase n=1 Tax=Bifidobacterium callimiconis TaxID=2306973 RepID=A0A430FDF5_9BIFI|nr:RICIN domain-containing protein [Bifidobacterium callimiconis]RSX50883.1 1,4-beta-N-acetylmuramidase [Bifidobacterium callimiconis]
MTDASGAITGYDFTQQETGKYPAGASSATTVLESKVSGVKATVTSGGQKVDTRWSTWSRKLDGKNVDVSYHPAVRFVEYNSTDENGTAAPTYDYTVTDNAQRKEFLVGKGVTLTADQLTSTRSDLLSKMDIGTGAGKWDPSADNSTTPPEPQKTAVSVAAPAGVTTQAGTAPTLPATAKVTWSDNSVTDETVTWDEVPAESYAQAGTFEVKGKAAGLDVTVTVTVEAAPAPEKTAVSVAAPAGVTTREGVAPTLPKTAKVTWSDNSVTDEAVSWDAVSADSYAKPGSFEVKGKAAGLDVTVKVTVENAPVSVEKLADVTTNVGTVAQLPKTAKVKWADGSTTEEAVDWSSVDSQRFFTIGSFTATGKAKGLDVTVNVDVTLKDGTYVIATAMEDGSRVVDMTNASKAVGARAQLYSANGTMAQRFKFRHLDNGNYTIKNVNSGLFLAHGDVAGEAVTQQKDDAGAAIEWELSGTDSALTIASASTSLALDVQGGVNADGIAVQVFDGNGSVAQQWRISGAETPRDRLDRLADEHRNDIADGTYKFAAGKRHAEVLDVSNGSHDDGANVQIFSGNGTDAQAWTIRHDADGYLTITNAGSGKVLDVSNGSTDPGANVQQFSGNGTWAQKWIAVSTANGFKIQSGAAENLVLDVAGGDTADGTNVQIFSSNDSAAQRWRLKKTTTSRDRLDKLAADHQGDVADGTYEIASTAKKAMRFDVAGGSSDDGANVQLYESNGTDAQAWKVSHDGNGYVTLTNAKSGKVLDVSNASTGDGANVQQWSSNGSRAQKWVLVKDKNGAVTLHSALREDFVIDADNGGTTNGTNIQMWSSNNSAAQHWTFNKK